MEARPADESSDYRGWAAAGLIVLAVIAVGAYLWFHYHP
jgi:hypothetical protein